VGELYKNHAKETDRWVSEERLMVVEVRQEVVRSRMVVFLNAFNSKAELPERYWTTRVSSQDMTV